MEFVACVIEVSLLSRVTRVLWPRHTDTKLCFDACVTIGLACDYVADNICTCPDCARGTLDSLVDTESKVDNPEETRFLNVPEKSRKVEAFIASAQKLVDETKAFETNTPKAIEELRKRVEATMEEGNAVRFDVNDAIGGLQWRLKRRVNDIRSKATRLRHARDKVARVLTEKKCPTKFAGHIKTAVQCLEEWAPPDDADTNKTSEAEPGNNSSQKKKGNTMMTLRSSANLLRGTS